MIVNRLYAYILRTFRWGECESIDAPLDDYLGQGRQACARAADRLEKRGYNVYRFYRGRVCNTSGFVVDLKKMSEPQKENETTEVNLLHVSVGADRKYTVIQDAHGRLRALRYGEEWRNCSGDGLVLHLAQEVDKLRGVLGTMMEANRDLEAAKTAQDPEAYKRLDRVAGNLHTAVELALPRLKDLREVGKSVKVSPEAMNLVNTAIASGEHAKNVYQELKSPGV